MGQKSAEQCDPLLLVSRFQESVVCWLLGMMSLDMRGGWLV